MSDVHEVLVAARNLIDREGWVQNQWHVPGVGRCINGAIGGADSTCTNFVVASSMVAAAAGVGSNVMAAIEWNNAPERTKADVLAAFDEAIAATAPAPDLQLTALPDPDMGESDMPLPVPSEFFEAVR